MADKDKTNATPTPANRIAANVTVRVVKQPLRHKERTYLGPRQGKDGPLAGETFKATAEDVERYGKLVTVVEEAAA